MSYVERAGTLTIYRCVFNLLKFLSIYICLFNDVRLKNYSFDYRRDYVSVKCAITYFFTLFYDIIHENDIIYEWTLFVMTLQFPAKWIAKVVKT